MKFEQAHTLGKDEAKARVQVLTKYWHDRYGVAVNWTSDYSAHAKGSVKGVEFDATLTIRDSDVSAEGTDPGFLVRAAITAYLRQQLSEYLDPKKSVEDLGRMA